LVISPSLGPLRRFRIFSGFYYGVTINNTAALAVSLYGIAKTHKPDSAVCNLSDVKMGWWNALDNPILWARTHRLDWIVAPLAIARHNHGAEHFPTRQETTRERPFLDARHRVANCQPLF
jgi:hypothetical protein